jgi:antitoxin component YwqK of YwqJK toxin-antitoxin module
MGKFAPLFFEDYYEDGQLKIRANYKAGVRID